MKRHSARRSARALAPLLLLAALCAPHAAGAPQRDKREYLTQPEIELVSDAQEIDQRAAVFIKAAERRIQMLTGQAPAKVSQKEAELWGELPKRTHAELLYDIAHILDAAIENVDDAAQRGKQPALLPRAVRKLAEASERFLAQLKPMRDSTRDRDEREQLEFALENLQQIITASQKLPAETKDSKGGKKN